LSSLEEQYGDIQEDVCGFAPVGGLYVPGGDDAGLLLGFVVLAFATLQFWVSEVQGDAERRKSTWIAGRQ
jgi:hypothetical protein